MRLLRKRSLMLISPGALPKQAPPSPPVSTAKRLEAPTPVVELDRPDAVDVTREWLRDEAPPAARSRAVTCQVVNGCFARGLSPDETLSLLTEEGGWNETKAEPPWEVDGDDGDETGNLGD